MPSSGQNVNYANYVHAKQYITGLKSGQLVNYHPKLWNTYAYLLIAGFYNNKHLTDRFDFHDNTNFTYLTSEVSLSGWHGNLSIHGSQKNVRNSRGRLIPTNEAAAGKHTYTHTHNLSRAAVWQVVISNGVTTFFFLKML